MTSIPHNSVPADFRERTGRSDNTERSGLIGWQRSAWSSVLMAAVTAISCQLVFTALGFAIGVTAAEVTNGQAADSGDLGVAAGAWWLITGTISLLIGGLILGRMSGIPRNSNLILAALAMWAVTAVFGFFVVWSGMMSAVSSPLAVMSAPAIDSVALNQQRSTGSGYGAESSVNPGSTVANAESPSIEQAQAGARTASWWGVVGMLIGAGVSMGGAWVCAPKASIIVGDIRHE